MTYTDDEIRPYAEYFRTLYDGLGIPKTDEEIWFLAIDHMNIKKVYFEYLKISNKPI
jgi:hypothetical protein